MKFTQCISYIWIEWHKSNSRTAVISKHYHSMQHCTILTLLARTDRLVLRIKPGQWKRDWRAWDQYVWSKREQFNDWLPPPELLVQFTRVLLLASPLPVIRAPLEYQHSKYLTQKHSISLIIGIDVTMQYSALLEHYNNV